MPRVPKAPQCDCHYPANASEDIKLKILEEKLYAETLIGKDFTTNIAVGHLPSGTVLHKEDSLKDILYRILYQEITRQLTSIIISVPPTKATYIVGEVFNPAGMVVKANYSDQTSQVIENYTYSPSGALALTDNKITVSYTENGVTKTVDQAITVTAAVGVHVYKGLTSTLPSTEAEIEALTLDTSKFKNELLVDGYLWKNVSPNNQYVVLAIPESEAIDCYSILQGTYSMDPIRVDIGKYRLYHTGNPATETGYRLTYLFEKD